MPPDFPIQPSSRSIYSGILCTGHSQGTFTQNQVFAHGVVNVKIMLQANPLFSDNAIHSSQNEGILVVEGGKGHFSENSICDNLQTGLVVMSAGNPTVIGNHVQNGKGNGIWVKSSGLGLYRKNKIHANKGLAGGRACAGCCEELPWGRSYTHVRRSASRTASGTGHCLVAG